MAMKILGFLFTFLLFGCGFFLARAIPSESYFIGVLAGTVMTVMDGWWPGFFASRRRDVR